MLSSRSAACSAVNLAGSDPRQRSSRESLVMNFCCSPPLQRRGFACVTGTTSSDPLVRRAELRLGASMHWRKIPPLKRRATATSLALDGERDGVAAAETQRGDSAMHVAALHFVQQRRQDTRAGSADGMPDGHGAAIHVYFRGIEMQFAGHGNCGCGKCFV